MISECGRLPITSISTFPRSRQVREYNQYLIICQLRLATEHVKVPLQLIASKSSFIICLIKLNIALNKIALNIKQLKP